VGGLGGWQAGERRQKSGGKMRGGGPLEGKVVSSRRVSRVNEAEGWHLKVFSKFRPRIQVCLRKLLVEGGQS
jgi:hypothetical protein